MQYSGICAPEFALGKGTDQLGATNHAISAIGAEWQHVRGDTDWKKWEF